MSCLQNELILESLYDLLLEEHPELSELEAIRLTEELFEDLAQWKLIHLEQVELFTIFMK